jgi:hypothetical protein
MEIQIFHHVKKKKFKKKKFFYYKWYIYIHVTNVVFTQPPTLVLECVKMYRNIGFAKD